MNVQIALENTLSTLCRSLAPTAEVHTGYAPQDAPYPIVLIEHIITRPQATLNELQKLRYFYYQVRVMATEREQALTITDALHSGILTTFAQQTALGSGWTSIELFSSSSIPTITIPDVSGVLYTQAGNEYTFLVQ